MWTPQKKAAWISHNEVGNVRIDLEQNSNYDLVVMSDESLSTTGSEYIYNSYIYYSQMNNKEIQDIYELVNLHSMEQ
jgi:hypothetical protein